MIPQLDARPPQQGDLYTARAGHVWHPSFLFVGPHRQFLVILYGLSKREGQMMDGPTVCTHGLLRYVPLCPMILPCFAALMRRSLGVILATFLIGLTSSVVADRDRFRRRGPMLPSVEVPGFFRVHLRVTAAPLTGEFPEYG